MTSRPALDGLPPEIIFDITDRIRETHRPSLSQFALVNKRCCVAARAHIFRRLKFNAARTLSVSAAVSRAIKHLTSANSLPNVRVIKVDARVGYEIGEESDDECDVNDSEEDDANPNSIDAVIHSESFTPNTAASDQIWLPLISLIKLVPHLTTFTWRSRNTIPQAVLEALQTHPKHCQVTIDGFRFRSLPTRQMEACERAVVSSPIIHSITAGYTRRGSDGIDDWNEEAIMESVQKLLPNLAELNMELLHAVSSPKLMAARGRPRQPWLGFDPPLIDTRHGLARMERLGLIGIGRISTSDLSRWSTLINFDALTHLRLTRPVSGSIMQWATEHVQFPSLTTLEISLFRDDESSPKPDYPQQAVAFCSYLPPLQSLELIGALDEEIVRATLAQHGPSLRKFALDPFESMYSRTRADLPMLVDRALLDSIVQGCPSVEELELPVKREISSSSEVELYRILGHLMRLRKLRIILDCAHRPHPPDEDPPNPYEDPWDRNISPVGMGQGVPNGDIKRALINCAIDETLARSVWDVIVASRRERRRQMRDSHEDWSDSGCRLERLELLPRGAASFGGSSYVSSMVDICSNLARQWSVERNPRGQECRLSDDVDAETRAAPPIVSELNKKYREREDARLRDFDAGQRQRWANHNFADNIHLQCFRRVWPPREDSVDWRDDWSSFPLELPPDLQMS